MKTPAWLEWLLYSRLGEERREEVDVHVSGLRALTFAPWLYRGAMDVGEPSMIRCFVLNG